MSGQEWAEKELTRLGQETKEIHKRIDHVRTDVGELKTDLSVKIAENGTKLDTLIKANGKSGGAITKGQLILAAALITGMFGLIEVVIAMVK